MTTQTTTSTTITKDEAVTMGQEILRLEATVKEMKEKLKEYVKKNGELDTGDVVWKFQSSESYAFKESENIKDFLKSIVIDGYTTDPYSVLTVARPKVNKLGIEDSYISNFAEKKVTTRFVNRKK